MAKAKGANGKSATIGATEEAHSGPSADIATNGDEPTKLREKEYQRELRALHGELVAMQEWVKASGAKLCRDEMFAATNSGWAPWYVAQTDDKKRGRLNIISHLLAHVPYDRLKVKDITLPRRHKSGRYKEMDLNQMYIPTPF